MANVRPGNFRLRSRSPDLVFEAAMDGPWLPTDDSYGGWEIVAIPRRTANTEWSGDIPVGVQGEFYSDRTNADPDNRPGVALRSARDTLERMAKRRGRREPPLLVFNAGGWVSHDYESEPNALWYIESLAWDKEKTVVNSVGNPLLIAGTLVLRQYNRDEALGRYRGPAAKNKKRSEAKKKKEPNRHKKAKWVVVGGTPSNPHTLLQIAANELGDASKWGELAERNNIRNPRGLRVGQRIRIPE